MRQCVGSVHRSADLAQTARQARMDAGEQDPLRGVGPRLDARRMMDDRRAHVVTETGTAEIVDRKSRFCATLWAVEDERAVARRLDTIRAEHPKATHHVYAWRLRASDGDPIAQRCHDDGEPGGTAGRPVLQQLEAHGLVNALCVVVRYFGGVKLGAGGLVRAYARTAGAAIAAATLELRVPLARMRLRVAFDQVSAVEAAIARAGFAVLERSFEPEPVWRIELPRSELAGARRQLREATAGRIEFTEESR
ncbi:MAG: hypothetical protein GF330_06860 [Candidatus Eisenbacteria bacterium]|nr:hypothetical protein [Candidatus Eisenbacteria bacterium]